MVEEKIERLDKKEDEKKIVENTVKYCKKKMCIKSRDNISICNCIQAAIIFSKVTCPATLDSEPENLPALLKADQVKVQDPKCVKSRP